MHGVWWQVTANLDQRGLYTDQLDCGCLSSMIADNLSLLISPGCLFFFKENSPRRFQCPDKNMGDVWSLVLECLFSDFFSVLMQFWLTLFCYQFFALLLIVFALEVTAGVMGYVYKDKVQYQSFHMQLNLHLQPPPVYDHLCKTSTLA